MNILGVLIYVMNVFLGLFAFNQVKTEQQKVLIIHGVIGVTISLASVYFFVNDYFIEALVLTVVGGLPIVYHPGSTPDFFYRNLKRFNIALVVSVIISIILVFIIVFVEPSFAVV